ncbi:SpoIIAA family protein [Cochleicola gelatinilyticus]|uniref:STAS/SEC14 domain-containing protein n=1 Tax=Cochleicola gelatinilyticus TaxID=1763537 RepID=A0A167F107_9FLAO|nr:STAS/SEC14 domain-containing protein [Cochleicola gelatinilyticus]OAB76081.1 hypothetical protein ULVI_13565 [Cochleicola gelatinilyticus]
MIKIEQIQNKNIYLFKVTDAIDQAGVETFITFLETKADNNEKIKVIGVMESLPGFENFKTFVEMVKLKSKAITVIEKYAVLTNKDWIEKIIPIGNFMTPGIPVKHFAINEREAAIEWLEQIQN